MKQPFAIFTKETLVKGEQKRMTFVDILGQTYSVNKGPVTTLSLEDEWYEDVHDPEAVLHLLNRTEPFKPDIFTFWQRLPDLKPKYSHHIEWEEIAVLSINSYDDWFTNHLSSRTRGLIRKAEKEGVEVRETEYNDAFVLGMVKIFNESPIRQGRRFWHYGKDFATVKRQFSRYTHREYMLGAYYRGEMIGFMMLGNAGTFALTGQIISAIRHRDKLPNNLLIAKAVDLCSRRGLPKLCYFSWSENSLTEFKRRCGFERVSAPRYYIPLTIKGTLALRTGLHRGWKELLPHQLKASLKSLRRRWYEWTSCD